MMEQKAQLLRGKADHSTYVLSLASNFQSQRQSDFSEVTQFHARYLNGTLLSKMLV